MSTNNGGPAFPVAFTTTPLTGMTLRDYFAAQALPALIADGGLNSYLARDAYAIADAMLRERNQ